MNKLFLFIILAARKLKLIVCKPFWRFKTKFIFQAFNIRHGTFNTNGTPYIYLKNGVFKIGDGFRMNNSFIGNIIGRQQKCIFIVNKGKLEIGTNVGISSTAIVCHQSVKIGDNVRIGGNTVIYDTDFHSLNFEDRVKVPEIKKTIKSKPVIINQNVFIGAHTTILKGAFIGANSIIGAGSVVSGHIPENEIWAGNPASFIKKIPFQNISNA